MDISFNPKKGDLVNSLISDSEKAGNAVSSFLLLITSGFISLIYVLSAFAISPSFTLRILIIGLIIFISLKKFMGKRCIFGQLTSESNSEFQVVLDEHLDSLKLIKGTALTELSKRSISIATSKLARLSQIP